MMRSLWSLGGAVGVVALAVACSAGGGAAAGSSGGSGAGAAGGTGGAGGAGAGGGGTGGTGTGGGTGGSLSLDGGNSGGSGGLQDGGECTGTTSVGEQVPVDMYLMLDSSGSMLGQTSTGATKWSAVTSALNTFVGSPAATGLGIGLQFFPLPEPGAAFTCNTDADCGTGGPCGTKICASDSAVTYCSGNSDCGPFGPCVTFGICQRDPSYLCTNISATGCGGLLGIPGGACVPATGPYTCAGTATSCSPGDYASPAVPIAVGSSAAIGAALAAQTPAGLTPTGPALQGALDHAAAHAQANPGRRAIVVLATDGFPTECSPLGIAQIAALARGGANATPSIQTFVIGVFAPAEAVDAQANLDQIAQAGSGRPALVIDTTQNVQAEFAAALDEIRGSALACEFFVPEPPAGETLDYGRVNVGFTAGSGATQSLYYVADAASCDPVGGGWYYDVDPATGGTPTKIVVCPVNCDQFEATVGGRVDVKLGCATEVPQ